MAGKLDTYQRKRRFDATPEPSGAQKRAARGAAKAAAATSRARRCGNGHALSYVIQEHDARRLHYDFRLELDGTLKSWAIPKGPCLDPSVKRLAVHVEDHPIEYGSFEGEIPEGNYGAGTVLVWDRGVWEPVGSERQAIEAYRAGKLKFRLEGEKLHGGWTLVRSGMRGSGDKEQWLLIKERDEEARSTDEYDVLAQRPGSVLSRGGAEAARRGAADARQGARHGARHGSKHPTKADRPDIVATRNTESLRELAREPGIEGAVKAALPAALKPQLATLVDFAPPGNDWIYEIKFDGYRVLARIDHHARKEPVRIFTRTGNDWTAKFGRQARAFASLDLESAWLDGEAVVLDRHGMPDFQALQNAFDANRAQDIVIFVFDVPFLNGYDLRAVPLVQRRAILRALFADIDERTHGLLRFSEDFAIEPDELLQGACASGLEGIIAKRADSHYTSARASSWLKLKCRQRQEFVIGGYTEPAGSRAAFGSLLLGVYDAKGTLHYAGRVGTGFDAAKLRAVKKELDALETPRMAFASMPRERSSTPVHWVKPELVCECNFAQWTGDGLVRQASFVSLRRDKPARQVTREAPVHAAASAEQPAQDRSNQEDTMQQTGEATQTGKGKRTAKAASKTASKTASKADAKSVSTRVNRARDTDEAVDSSVAKKRATRAASSAARGSGTSSARSRNASTEVAGVRISHPDRVIDRDSGTRKLDLVHYWEWVAPWLLPHLQQRPVSLVRAPEDISGELFFQKHAQKLEIPHITQHAGLDPGHAPLLTIDSVEALLGAAQMGVIELHTWNALVTDIERPDRMVFDLDPDPVLGWDRMIEAAELTRTVLTELGLESFCKTSGGKGLHVVVPLTPQAGWDEVKAFSQVVAQHMAATLPDRFSAKMGPQNRKRKIFVDYLRNNRGSSTIAAYSVRARPGLGVSVPISWDEVPQTTAGNQWTIANLHERLDALRKDPWAGYAKTRQRITATMKKRLGIKG
ncbi:DNA ligase D [Paraburkholderia kururiensis]|uniref:DNA ligase (ATP) n=1 Tax=Paraburkholderia kururiensis TaxID=984307 RepID=A0ABZ0WS10_9BURK|nr:DNA ligase D [Paraburkholderia kururiensis]WQD80184.1 DNA ligase D [Paraburkholderia kururiensis]